MTIKREAAYHEAGHAIIANGSKFHALVSGIDLAEYGAGEIHVSLSKSKLAAAGKSPEAASAKDPEVAKDLALVLTAGYVAEQLAAEKDKSLVPSIDCARPDHDLLRQQLQAAGLSKKFDRFENEVAERLRTDWDSVEMLATELFTRQRVTLDELQGLLNDTHSADLS